MRKPDDVVWSWKCWMVGFAKQEYGFKAGAYTLYFGPLTLRWSWK